MKIKNKKSFIAITSLLLIIAVGVTFAVIYSSSTRDNLFNIGNYSVVTSETFESPVNWLPGETIDKSIFAMNNGNINAAFRIKYVEKWEDASGNDITSSVPNDAVTINFINKAHWTYNSTDGYYYHKYYIKPSESSCSLISGVTLNEDLMGSASCTMSGDTYNCTSDLDGLAGAKYILTFTKETVAYDKYQDFWNTDEVITEEPPLVQIMNSDRTKDNLQVGDEICVNGPESTECFNFIGYDGNNIKMLSKYNLNVGNNIQPGDVGIQNSLAIGYNSDSSTAVNNYYPASVKFSGTNYWNDRSGLKPEYGTSYPADVYDIDYNEATGNNYSVAYYVENYKNTLESYGLTVNDARLLTYSEATDSSIGCSSTCPTTGFITNTSFWLGSAIDDNYVWNVYSDGGFISDDFYDDNYFGVRPVIVISKSDI